MSGSRKYPERISIEILSDANAWQTLCTRHARVDSRTLEVALPQDRALEGLAFASARVRWVVPPRSRVLKLIALYLNPGRRPELVLQGEDDPQNLEFVTVTTRGGQSVELIDSDGNPESIVDVREMLAGQFGTGYGRWEATLTLPANRRELLLDCYTCVLREEVWNIIGVGEVSGFEFVVSLRRDETKYSNRRDLSGKQSRRAA